MDAERLDIDKTLQAMTPEEKLRMLSGDGMWHTFAAGELPRVRMSDGPNGIRMTAGTGAMSSAIPATCFPTTAMLANSWDPALLYNIGAALGNEATAMGVNLLLAPGLNIKRDPRCGRNFEYFSEDPYLAGTLGKAYVDGVQSTGVGACIKHFAANNQESHRMYCDSVVDPRALREIYLKPFEIALEAEPAAVMCAYNKLNGTYCSENEFLLKKVLRDDWNYRGITVSDWGAVRSRARSLKAGLDLEMPDSLGVFDEELKAAYDSGEITDDMLGESLHRTLELVDNVYLEPYGDFDADSHDRLAYAAAVDSTVLLKNDNGFLPLTKDMRVAVIGDLAEHAPIQGGGSSHVTPLYAMSPLDAFSQRAVDISYYRGYSSDPKENSRLYDEALTGAMGSDAVIVYVGAPVPYEGVDRKTLELPPEQNKLIGALTNAGHRVVVVICSVGPVLMPWIKRVRSVVYSGLNGARGALAAVDVLYGRVNPRGKLAETFPLAERALPPSDFGGYRALYRESIFVGYRYYDSKREAPLFPFGHGLSFSDISYDEMRVKRVDGTHFVAIVKLTNRSTRDAFETVQIYIADNTGRIMHPEKQLAGYQKVFIEGQTTTTAAIVLDRRAFQFWDEKQGRFCISDGQYKIISAASAIDLKMEVTVKVDGDFKENTVIPPSYTLPLGKSFEESDFCALYGAPLPAEKPRPKKGEYDLDCCLDDIKKSFAGRIAVSAVKRRAKNATEGPEREAFITSALFTPLTAAASMSDGAVSPKTARAMTEMANGHFWRGVKLMLKKDKERDK